MLKWCFLALLIPALANCYVSTRHVRSSRTQTIDTEFVFAIPHLHHDYADETTDKNFLTVINDAGEAADITVTYGRLENPITFKVDPAFYTRVPIDYFQATGGCDNSITFTDDVVKVESTQRVTVIFEQTFGPADPQNKAMLIYPKNQLGFKYITPGPTNGPAVMAFDPFFDTPDETPDANATIKAPGGLEIELTNIPEGKAVQNQLPGFDAAVIESSSDRNFTIQAGDGTHRLEMLPHFENFKQNFVVGPGAYKVYATDEEPSTNVLLNNVVEGVATPRRPASVDTDAGGILTAEEGHPVFVLYENQADWVALPSVEQFVTAGDIQFTSLNGQSTKARVFAEQKIVGLVLLNSHLIPVADWTEAGDVTPENEMAAVKFFYVDVDIDQDLNRLSTRRAGRFSVMVYSDFTGYVPTYDIQ